MIKRLLQDLMYAVFGSGSLLMGLALGFIGGAIAGGFGTLHLIHVVQGDDDTDYHPAAFYSSSPHEVTSADLARCHLIETGRTDEEAPEPEPLKGLLPLPGGYEADVLLKCSDELDTLAFETARVKHQAEAIRSGAGSSSAVKTTKE